tara:strand:- start:302 stop:1504 length:1203 start_codon:yes stop_codon:yes gene_type:complete
MIAKNKKIIVIGGGILGLSIVRNFLIEGYKNILLLEKENKIASHQSSRNSGVMHAGIYYKPNSLKAKLSRDGIFLLKEYCTKNDIRWKECGKVIVATSEEEINLLNNLLERGKKNKLKGIEIISSKEINSYEPYVNGKAGIIVPEESVVNYLDVANKYKEEIIALGGTIKLSAKVEEIKHSKNYEELILSTGETLKGEIIIATAGLYSDKVTKKLGINIDKKRIIPFKGEYYKLKPSYEYLVNGLIYPVPNPKLPFLGVHFTKMINGEVEAGPNAVLALAREGYKKGSINLKDLYETLSYSGMQKFFLKYPITSTQELIRSLSKFFFTKSLQKLIPDIKSNMIIESSAGIRAQLMNHEGELEQDFDIRIKKNLISILNAPSPAATSSLSIAKYIVNYLIK